MTREEMLIGNWVNKQIDSMITDSPIEEKVEQYNVDISDFLPEFQPEECYEDFSDLIVHTLADDIFE